MQERGRIPRTITLSVKSLFVILALAGAVAAGLVLRELAEEQDDLDQEIESLAEVVNAQEQRIDQTVEELESAGTQALIPLRRRLTSIAFCLPELQAQLNTLEVDFGFAFPSDTPSQRCQGVLYGNEDQAGD